MSPVSATTVVYRLRESSKFIALASENFLLDQGLRARVISTFVSCSTPLLAQLKILAASHQHHIRHTQKQSRAYHAGNSAKRTLQSVSVCNRFHCTVQNVVSVVSRQWTTALGPYRWTAAEF